MIRVGLKHKYSRSRRPRAMKQKLSEQSAKLAGTKRKISTSKATSKRMKKTEQELFNADPDGDYVPSWLQLLLPEFF